MRTYAAVVLAGLLVAGCTSSHPSSQPTSRHAPQHTSAPSSPLTSAPTTASTTSPPAPPAPAAADWPTYQGNPQRTGVSASMPAVTQLHVATQLRLDGAVYASPIVANQVTYAVTENDTVYAFDSAYHQLWKRHLGTPSPASERPCGDIDPLGITGTPIYQDGTVYLSAEYGGPVRHDIVALDAATGAVRWRKNIDLPGAQALVMQQRGALTIAGGRVWIPFGGLAGDCGPYKGRVVGVRLDGGGSAIAFTVPTTKEAGIWTPPGPTVDTDGRLFVSVGNGGSGPGDPYDFSDSVLVIGSGDAKLLDSYSPRTWASDNAGDLDLGSQGPAIVGDWIFADGKSGTAYVLRRSHLGGIGGEVSSAQVCRSFGGTAVVGDVVYVPCTDGLRAVRIDSSGRMHISWHASNGIDGTPVVGGGKVFSLDAPAGLLLALDPATGRAALQVKVGRTTRFATPAISGKQVIVPTYTGITVVTTS